MIRIYKTSLKVEDGNAKISVKYEVDNKVNYLWYSVPEKFKDFLVTENIDSFFIGLLLYAMKNGHDIELLAPVSEKLYYTVTHYILNALNLANSEMKMINVIPSKLNSNNINVENSVCTGMSGGVDSFCTIYEHLEELDPYKIQYFTFFNAGSHGDFGGNMARKLFKDRLEIIKPYAEKINVDIITIDTNLNEILMMNHETNHFIRSISCILNLQKLIKYYYYSSAYRLDYFKNTSRYGILMTSMLSTESTNIFSSSSRYTRTQRTDLISNYNYSYEYLNVCIASSTSYIAENCSVCGKCLRTELTLDILGKLNLYKKVFNIEKFKSAKDRYIGSILSEAKDEQYIFSKEIIQLMKDKNYEIPKKAYFYYFIIEIKKNTKKILIAIFGEKLCKGFKRKIFNTIIKRKNIVIWIQRKLMRHN